MTRTISHGKSNIKRLVVLGALLVAVILPFLQAPMAQAATVHQCTVVPGAPYFAGQFYPNTAIKKINYPINVNCAGFRTVTIRQEFLERDGDSPTYVYHSYGLLTHVKDAGIFGFAGTITGVDALPETEAGPEEMLHQVSFRVQSGGVTGAWTAWQKSPARGFTN